MSEENDKLSRINSVLTDEVVHVWMASEENELKIPPTSVTAAFREAEHDFFDSPFGDDHGSLEGEDNYDE